MKANIRILPALYLFIVLCQVAYAQENKVLTSSTSINPNRYDKIHGSPYMYDQWMPASAIGPNGKPYAIDAVNFNGMTKELEIRENSKPRELRPESYLKVTISNANHSDIFMRGIHPQLGLELICISYNGDRIKLIKEFSVRKEASNSAVASFERFVPKSNYYLLIDGQLELVSIRKKKILKQLNAPTDLEEYLDKTDNSVKSEEDLITLLKYYETNNLHQ